MTFLKIDRNSDVGFSEGRPWVLVAFAPFYSGGCGLKHFMANMRGKYKVKNAKIMNE